MTEIKTEYEKAKLQIEIDAQKEAMKNIGKEIHDGVGQKLTLASIYLKKKHSDTTIELDNISEISNLIDESLTELRSLSRSLVNPDKQHSKLHDLILLEAKRVKAINGINIIFSQNAEINFQEDVKNNILRIIQEVIQNCIKHASCSEIKILFYLENDKLSVTCTDNGVGFDVNSTNTSGVGLTNIKNRVEEMHGEMALTSERGKGTHLNFVVSV